MTTDSDIPPALGDVEGQAYAQGGSEHEWLPFKYTRLYTNAFIIEGNKVCSPCAFCSASTRSPDPAAACNRQFLDLAITRFQETWFRCWSVSRFPRSLPLSNVFFEPSFVEGGEDYAHANTPLRKRIPRRDRIHTYGSDIIIIVC